MSFKTSNCDFSSGVGNNNVTVSYEGDAAEVERLRAKVTALEGALEHCLHEMLSIPEPRLNAAIVKARSALSTVDLADAVIREDAEDRGTTLTATSATGLPTSATPVEGTEA